MLEIDVSEQAAALRDVLARQGLMPALALLNDRTD